MGPACGGIHIRRGTLLNSESSRCFLRAVRIHHAGVMKDDGKTTLQKHGYLYRMYVELSSNPQFRGCLPMHRLMRNLNGTTAPGLTYSAVTIAARPIAATSKSASCATAGKSRIREWRIVTVALRQQHRHGLTDDVRAPDHDGPFALDRNIGKAPVCG